jgi:hypothetical protein
LFLFECRPIAAIAAPAVSDVTDAPTGIDLDGAASDAPSPGVAPAEASSDAALPAAISGSISDAVVAAANDESHTVDLAMIAGIALAVHGVRKSIGRTEEEAAVPVVPA